MRFLLGGNPSFFFTPKSKFSAFLQYIRSCFGTAVHTARDLVAGNTNKGQGYNLANQRGRGNLSFAIGSAKSPFMVHIPG